MLDQYHAGDIDALHIISNNFVNSMTQSPQMEQLIPVQPMGEEEFQHHWDYIYEPDAKEVLDMLLERYMESLIYQRVVENIACEQAARMVAMKSGLRQRQQAHRRTAAGIQQSAPSRHHPRTVRNRRRSRRSLMMHANTISSIAPCRGRALVSALAGLLPRHAKILARRPVGGGLPRPPYAILASAPRPLPCDAALAKSRGIVS